jgi:hypothetical protein
MTSKDNSFYYDKDYQEKQRQKKIGKNNPRWKGGNSYNYQRNFYGLLGKSLEQKCALCGIKDKLIIHHIDKNYKNNVIANICIVCRGCHNKIHKSEKK